MFVWEGMEGRDFVGGIASANVVWGLGEWGL